MERKRIQWLDIAKGLAIILMILGHTSIPKFAADFIWLFHMPLFFIASGYTTNWGGIFGLHSTQNKKVVVAIPMLLDNSTVHSDCPESEHIHLFSPKWLARLCLVVHTCVVQCANPVKADYKH